jgi:hypothetical protein
MRRREPDYIKLPVSGTVIEMHRVEISKADNLVDAMYLLDAIENRLRMFQSRQKMMIEHGEVTSAQYQRVEIAVQICRKQAGNLREYIAMLRKATFERKFVEIARQLLPPGDYDAIHRTAVEASKRAVEQAKDGIKTAKKFAQPQEEEASA